MAAVFLIEGWESINRFQNLCYEYYHIGNGRKVKQAPAAANTGGLYKTKNI